MSKSVKLANGELLECRIIDDPDDDDVPQLSELLGHKGGIWEFHLEQWRTEEAKRLGTRFYVASIGADLVANIMVLSHRGLGLMGHVFTRPEHRRKGICDVLMDYHMEDWRKHDGDALFLGTGFESSPYRIYERHGYRAVPGRPGSMWWSPDISDIDELWSSIYADAARADVEDLAWQHWPSLNAFTHWPGEQMVRNVSWGIYGVSSSEGEFLEIKLDTEQTDSTQAKVLETRDGHVCGLATLAPERRWGKHAGTWLFDLYVHPDAGECAEDLIKDFTWPDAHVLAYAAEDDDFTIDLLANSNFHPHSHIERFFENGVGLVIMDHD
jgi:GNAT superfamily N-acetyltransferase